MIVVVTGLGRCGSSLMLDMLEAGGIPPSSHAVRELGLEDDRVHGHGVPGDAGEWLAAEEGRAIKFLRMDPFDLPLDIEYRIVFMVRAPEAIARGMWRLLSESTRQDLLEQNGGSEEGVLETARLVAARDTEIMAVLLKYYRAPLLPIVYEDLIDDPIKVSENVAEFLGLDALAARRMARVVRERDESLPFQPFDRIGLKIAADGGL